MRILIVGAGPAGLYFGILMKKAAPAHEVLVLERNRPDDTFGFGVVFSDATLEKLAQADPESYREITESFAHWDDIHIHFRGQRLESTGHGFSGLSRRTLLRILQRRCDSLGVRQRYDVDVVDPAVYEDADLLLGADGANSAVRARHAEHFRPHIEWRPNRFVWFGTTFPFPAFTFYFKENEHGLWRVHAYRYDREHSTFIVETTEDAWRGSGMDRATEEETSAYCESLFADELAGHPLLRNRSVWRSFPTITNERWSHENTVLVGDAAHTAHFSVGSGTKLAMEDVIVLAEEIGRASDLGTAFERYEARRRPDVESLQRAARVSAQWFEDTERYMNLEPLQFAFSLLTRSLRVTHEGLKARDPRLTERADVCFAGGTDPVVPPLFTPFRLRELELRNRVVVSPMCQYFADDGTPGEWHLVHLGSRAMGGAGLVMTEMTDVARDARISPGCTGMYKPEHVDAWRRIVEFVHRHTEARIGMQLAHAGRKGSTRLAWEGMDEPLPDGNWPIIAPSPLPYYLHSQIPREMTREDMTRVRDEFVRAAGMAEEAGFDLLELHFAHGYLLGSFLSPLTNLRRDEYGGSLESRMRYPLEIFDAVRSAWPQGRPISVRVSATDWKPGGFEPADAVELARALRAHGCDIIDVSAGQTVPDQKPIYGRQFQTPFSERVRLEAGIPTMTVGNISSYADVNTILVAGRADLVVMARAHLYDPYWTRHAATELGYDLPWPAPYSTLRGYKPRFK